MLKYIKNSKLEEKSVLFYIAVAIKHINSGSLCTNYISYCWLVHSMCWGDYKVFNLLSFWFKQSWLELYTHLVNIFETFNTVHILSSLIWNSKLEQKMQEKRKAQEARQKKLKNKKTTEGNKLKIFEILTRRKIIVIQKTKTFIFVRLWNKFNILIFHPLHPSYRTESALFLHWSVYAAVAWVYYTAQYPISVWGKINQFVFSLSVLKYKLLPTVLAQL